MDCLSDASDHYNNIIWYLQKTLECKTPVTKKKFFNVMQTFYNKPNIFNKQLYGSTEVWMLSTNSIDIHALMREINFVYGLLFYKEFDPFVTLVKTVITEYLRDIYEQQSLKKTNSIRICLRYLIPKKTHKFNKMLELVIFDFKTMEVIFIPTARVDKNNTVEMLLTNDEIILIQTIYNKISLYKGSNAGPEIKYRDKGCHSSKEWLCDVLLPKIVKKCNSKGDGNSTNVILQTISISEYANTYDRLKIKYNEKIKQLRAERDRISLYRDIGIAAFLLVLWKTKQSFIDMNCGIGILTWLLKEEGHFGKGFDICKRNSWEHFDCMLNTYEEAGISFSENIPLFPSFTWIIASDKMTPWAIPMAMLSNYECNFIVFPSYAWDFNGKFERSTHNISKKTSYTTYIEDIGKSCGFILKRENLRIISGKQICFISEGRTYPKENYPLMKTQCEEFLQNSKNFVDPCKNISNEIYDNGTLVNIHEKIIMSTFKQLLKTENIILITENTSKRTESGRLWNIGTTLPITEIIATFDKETLSLMKSRNNGINSVLKGCPDVFIIKKDSVSLRDWTSPEYEEYKKHTFKKNRKKILVKTKICFHYRNHPNSCPLSSEKCRFAHGINELR